MSQIDIATDWATEYKDEIARSAEIALAAVQADFSLRVPRSEEERRHGFADWLENKRVKYTSVMEDAVRKGFSSHLPRSVSSSEVTERYVWPAVENWLRSFALGYYAGAWVRSHMGDATTLSMAEPKGDYWRIPLGLNGYGEDLGQVVLDADGNLIPHLTSTRQQMLEKIRGREFSPAKTITE